MGAIIVFLYLLVPVMSSSILQRAATVIEHTLTQDISYCNVSFAKDDIIKCDIKDGIINEGESCMLMMANHTIEILTCDSGLLFFTGRKGTDFQINSHTHKIDKRFMDWIILGLVLLTVGGSIVCGLLCGGPQSSPAPKPNEPPSIVCHTDKIKKEYIALKGKDSVVVTWPDPTATDPENSLKEGTPKLEQGRKSGSSFTHGTHVIVYKAEDTHGNSDTCSIKFKVTVIKCNYEDTLFVQNGRHKCSAEALYGASCTFECDSGYKLDPPGSRATCETTSSNKGVWKLSNNFKCKRKQCAQPKGLCNGKFKCSNGHYYESVCYAKCNPGYSINTADQVLSIRCDGQTWEGMERVSKCKDIQAPKFVKVPENIKVFADESGKAVVTWGNVEAVDNSESSSCEKYDLKVDQTLGLRSGSEFSIGVHKMQYKAIDSSGNFQIHDFVVIVEALSCPPLVLQDSFLLNSCPDGHNLGAMCTLSCFLSYKMNGSPNVTCSRDPFDSNKAKWAWTNGTETFCEKLTCPDLPPPAGGALACSTALGNKICTMSCSDKYQVAKGTSTEYICNDQQIWVQGIPPNCTDRVHPSQAILPGELFYYYSGDCSNTSVQDGIKKNFVTVMESLDKDDGWDNICPDYCSVEGVTVTCGPLNGRRKRYVKQSHSLRKRATVSQIVLNFKLTATWQLDKNLWENEDSVLKLGSVIQNKVSSGELNVQGIKTGDTSFGYVEFDCPVGQTPVYEEEARCVGCNKGSYLQKDECLKCPQGTYQDQEYQINCTRCPMGTSTAENGSTSLSDCTDMCKPGNYSLSGVEPCSPCEPGTYQPNHGSTSCLKCSDLKFTQMAGSTDEKQCKILDLTLSSELASLTLSNTTKAVASFTIGFFSKCQSTDGDLFVMTFSSYNITIGKTMRFSILTDEYESILPDDVDLTKWTNIVLTLNGTTNFLSVYAQGVKISSDAIDAYNLNSTNMVEEWSMNIANVHGGCTLAAFFMIQNVLPDTEVAHLKDSCIANLSNPIYSMDSLYTAVNKDVNFSPTKCDAIDECLSNPCGDEHICVNDVDGYTCNCTGGYQGKDCQIPPDFCINNNCHSQSTCISNFANYTCLCSPGFSGVFCDHAIVNGNWSDWYETECSKSCGGGTMQKVRYCDNPEPDIYGENCEGSNTSTAICNTQDCPECPPWFTIRNYKNKFNCSTINDSISCIVTCEAGYHFLSDYLPLEEYTCGIKTNYEWPAKPPPCVRMDRPQAISTSTSIVYPSGCNGRSRFRRMIDNNLKSLRCAANGTCNVITKVSGCKNLERNRRSPPDVKVEITLSSDLSNVGDLKLDELFTHKVVSPGLMNILQIYSDLDGSLSQMNTTDVLTVKNEDGTIFEPDMSSFTFSSNVSCQEGQVEEELLCVDCPKGTYWNDHLCKKCPQGFYQNETGQSSCRSCPAGFTTEFVASDKKEDCSVGCPKGTYWNDHLCKKCPQGFYQNETGQSSCRSCPAGFTTEFVASDKKEDCSVSVQEIQTSVTGVKTRPNKDITTTTIVAVTISLMIAVIIVVLILYCKKRITSREKTFSGSTRLIKYTKTDMVLSEIDEHL